MIKIKITYIIFLLAASLAVITGCSRDDEPVALTGTGTVLDYAGTGHCSIVIQLDDGTRIQPLHFPDGFNFTEGQRVIVEYINLPNMVSVCGQGEVCNILSIVETGCGAPLIELTSANYSRHPNDAVYLHEVTAEEDCLRVKVSFAGGCTNHVFDLAVIRTGQNDGDTAHLELRHDSKGDMCEAYLTKELSFSLEQLREEGFRSFVFSALLINGESYTQEFVLD